MTSPRLLSLFGSRFAHLGLGLSLSLSLGCRAEEAKTADTSKSAAKSAAESGAGSTAGSAPESDAGDTGDTGETGETGETGDDPFSGEAAHVIPLADRTSMGYLLLLPPGTKDPKAPTRVELQTLVEQAFPERRGTGEFDLLLHLIATEPHTTDLGFNGELEVPKLDGEGEDEDEGEPKPEPTPDDEAAAKAERARVFDLIGLHIELIHIGIGEDTPIPVSTLTDPVLTRALEASERESLPSRTWALLLRADYRNQNAVRGLRLLQTLVRVVAEREGALIHDPDTLETLDVETFNERRLRAAAGNVADQIAIVPFPDPRHEGRVRMSTRGMRRFGSVDVELDGLPPDPAELQQASDLIAGLAFNLTKEAEVDVSGFAVAVPELLEVDCEQIETSYAERDYTPPCSGSVLLHLVERPAEDHDPKDHVVARIVAPRDQSDAPTYDHPQWVHAALTGLFTPAKPSPPPD